MSNYKKKRNRPDKDGKDRSIFMRYRNRILRECKEEGYINCSICGLPIDLSLTYPNPWSLTIDHVIPISRGGQTKEENLQPTHFKCNRRKGERLALTLEQVRALRELQGNEDQENIDKAKRGFVHSADWSTD